MNITQILVNVLGVAATCLVAHGVAGQSMSASISGTAVLGAGLCVLSNLAGLFQHPPTVTGPMKPPTVKP